MRRYVLPAVGILILVVLGGIFAFSGLLHPGSRDWSSQWLTYYKKRFSDHFKIPAEAEIVSAVETPGPIMGRLDRVVFRLPSTKRPSEWVGEIAKASGIGNFRQSGIWYDASHRVEVRPNKYTNSQTDNYLIRYRIEDQTYEAIWGWD